MKRSSKRGTILIENIIFIVLNLIFLAILILFLFTRLEGAAVLEEKYAKQIALIIDSAEPEMEIHLNMGQAFNKNEKGRDSKDIVNINGNIVTVKLRERGDYSYSFFNDVDAEAYSKRNDKEYIITINEKRMNENE